MERFNRTLKTMIRKFVHEDAKNWDKWLEPLLFAVREVPQASTGFSPFELLYGRQPRGVLDVLRETWEEGPSESKNEIQHVLDLRTKLHTLGQLSMENLLQAQDKQRRLYNRGARLRKFAPGDKVLVLLPTSSSKLLAKWQGPFEVTRRVGDLNYEVVRTDRSGARQIYHLNLLKKWSEVEPVMLATAVSGEDDLGPEVITKIQSLTLTPGGDHLSPSQLTDVARLQKDFADVFSPRPVLVPKTDGSVRFCVDYRKVNAVSKFSLGLAGYYRRFIPDYSELTSPLTDLTKKEVPDTVPWTEQCQQAFTQVKAALCGGPLLHSPDFSLPFLLQTDASDRGLGAVLTQEIKGEERPVLYISRKLSKRETMYSTIEKECLAIQWAVLTLRYYLLGREFTLCSDHAPLQWLHRMKDTNARITHWYLALQPFKFKVIHRPGTQMIVADFLSRNGGGGGGGAAGRRASRPESSGGGMWRGGRGSAKSAAGEGLRRQR